MSGRSLILSFSAALLVYAGTCQAWQEKLPILSPEAPKDYYRDHKRGWYWYEKEKIAKEKEEKKNDKAKQHHVPYMKDYTVETLWNMHPDDFQPLLLDFQKKAVMNPTEQNVKEYYEIQDIARRKSLAFANATAYVMQKYPELNVAADYPTAVPGRAALTRMQSSEISDRLSRARDDFGLIYFYSPSCQYCIEQEKIVDMFQKNHGWEIKKVNRDENPALVQMFDVRMVPYLLLIYRHSKDAIPVAAGVTALSEMEERIYRSVRLLTGEITPEEYSTYDFQKGRTFDVNAPLKNKGGER